MAYELRAATRVVRDAWLRAIRLEVRHWLPPLLQRVPHITPPRLQLAASPFQAEVESRRVQQQAQHSSRGKARALARTASKLEGLRATLVAASGGAEDDPGSIRPGTGGVAPVGTEGLHRVMRVEAAGYGPSDDPCADPQRGKDGGTPAGGAAAASERPGSDGESSRPCLSPPRQKSRRRRWRRSSSPPAEQRSGRGLPAAPLSAGQAGHSQSGDAVGSGEDDDDDEEEEGMVGGAESGPLSRGAAGLSPHLTPRTPTRRQWRARHTETGTGSESLPLFHPPQALESDSFCTLSEARTEEGSDAEAPARANTARVRLYDLIRPGSQSDEEARGGGSDGGHGTTAKAATPPTVSLHLVSLGGDAANGNGSTGSDTQSFETCEDFDARST